MPFSVENHHLRFPWGCFFGWAQFSMIDTFHFRNKRMVGKTLVFDVPSNEPIRMLQIISNPKYFQHFTWFKPCLTYFFGFIPFRRANMALQTYAPLVDYAVRLCQRHCERMAQRAQPHGRRRRELGAVAQWETMGIYHGDVSWDIMGYHGIYIYLYNWYIIYYNLGVNKCQWYY